MHKLKSSALSMGASTVANLAIEIENLARNENSKSFDLLPDLYEAFQNTINFFNDYKKLLK
jgi:HPt (histidine-containing phosphotransfer) domain-containing protein